MKGQQSTEQSAEFRKWGCFALCLVWIAWHHLAKRAYQRKLGPMPELTDAVISRIVDLAVTKGILSREMDVMRHADLVELAFVALKKKMLQEDKEFSVRYERKEGEWNAPYFWPNPTARVLCWKRDVDGDGDFDYTHFTALYGYDPHDPLPGRHDAYNPLPGSWTVAKGKVVNQRAFWITET